MRKYMNRLTVLLTTFIMVLAFTISVNAEGLTATMVSYGDLEADYTGKTIVLTTNDVHGAIENYKYVVGLKTELENRGAEVVLVDCGDFSQGSTYVIDSKGGSAVELMNMAGYRFAALGNHEFDFGQEALATNAENAEFKILSTNFVTREGGERVFDATATFSSVDSDLKLGFVGIATPETVVKSHPKNFIDYTVLQENDFAITQTYIDALKTTDGADIVIALSHLGVSEESAPWRSYDLYEANQNATNKIDMILDGHSHSVMTIGENNEPIMSTGTKLVNIGVVVIDEKTEKIDDNFLIKVDDNLPADTDVANAAKAIKDEVDAALGKKIATSTVILNGDRSYYKKEKPISGFGENVNGNRDGETNLGDLVTDAIKWYVTKEGTSLGVDPNNVVALTNGGGIRANILEGDITKGNILSVLPYGNTIAAITVTGEELLEALEVSTKNMPEELGGFPQVSGIKFHIETSAIYDPRDELYPGSTYAGPKTINRVTILDINGKEFDPKATYVVLSNDFTASGGDTYYVFKNATSQFDTGITMDSAVVDYIVQELGGVVGAPYENPMGQGRILVTNIEETQAALENAKAAGDTQAAVKEAITLIEIAEIRGDMDLYKSAVNELKEAAAKLSEDKTASDEALKEAQKALNEAEKKLNSIAKSVKVVTVNTKTVTAKAIDDAVKKFGGSKANVTTIVFGKKVKTIKANALKDYKKVKTIELQTKKLKKKAVKKSLKGSSVDTVKVRAGKKYVKKYKKIFTKKNAGKKVIVK